MPQPPEPAATAAASPDERISRHEATYLAKKPLRKLFGDIHKELRTLDERWFGSTPGSRIELGSGVAPMRDSYPDTLATDVVASRNIDAVMDAQNLDVPPGSVRALYLQNCFHHLPDPEAFFRSSERALAPGGGIVMLEPHWGPVASIVYPRLFKEEGFDKSQLDWRTPMDGPMNGANQALSYVVLKRDRQKFEAAFPNLELVAQGTSAHYMRYVLTGGLNFPQLLPTFMFPIVEGVEALAKPVAPVLGLHRWFVIRKNG